MSEREVRKKTRAYIERVRSGVDPCSIATEDAELDLEQALSEPPDVVTLLRWMTEAIREHHEVVYKLQEVVRLTADAWKWVD